MSANEPETIREALEIVKSTWATKQQKMNAHAYILRNEPSDAAMPRHIADALAAICDNIGDRAGETDRRQELRKWGI